MYHPSCCMPHVACRVRMPQRRGCALPLHACGSGHRARRAAPPEIPRATTRRAIGLWLWGLAFSRLSSQELPLCGALPSQWGHLAGFELLWPLGLRWRCAECPFGPLRLPPQICILPVRVRLACQLPAASCQPGPRLSVRTPGRTATGPSAAPSLASGPGRGPLSWPWASCDSAAARLSPLGRARLPSAQVLPGLCALARAQCPPAGIGRARVLQSPAWPRVRRLVSVCCWHAGGPRLRPGQFTAAKSPGSPEGGHLRCLLPLRLRSRASPSSSGQPPPTGTSQWPSSVPSLGVRCSSAGRAWCAASRIQCTSHSVEFSLRFGLAPSAFAGAAYSGTVTPPSPGPPEIYI